MRSVGITIVRNEADIIEMFVRYHVKVFDKLYVINHNSKDDTGLILDKLVAEGLPLVVLTEEIAWHCQAEAMTALARNVWRRDRPDWIVPLDGDEFLVGCDFDALRTELPCPEHVLFPVWHNYTPTEHDDAQETNVLRRIKYKNSKINTNQHKVIIPGYMMGVDGTYLPEGNHELYYKDGSPVSYSLARSAYIAHFPVRSVEQVQRKAFVGWPSKLANPLNNGKSPDWSHWKLFYDKFKNKETLTLKEMQSLAMGYTTDQNPGEMETVEQAVEIDPGMDNKYPPAPYPPLRALADTAELLAFNFMLSHHTGEKCCPNGGHKTPCPAPCT
jgi:hypothetical protein